MIINPFMMRKVIVLILLFTIQLGFTQKTYNFNLSTVYETTNSKGGKSLYINYNDTVNNNYRLIFYSKDNNIKNVSLLDFNKHINYNFEITNLNFEALDFSKDFKNYSTSKVPVKTNGICYRYKNYSKVIEKLNDSIQIETFNFYKDKKKKDLVYNVKIETLTTRFIKNIVPIDFVFIIKDCIDENYEVKIVKSINVKHYKNNELSFEENTKLLSINPTNISINIQQ